MPEEGVVVGDLNISYPDNICFTNHVISRGKNEHKEVMNSLPILKAKKYAVNNECIN